MATVGQKQPDPTQLNFGATPVQVGQEIRLAIQIGDVAGLAFSMLLTQEAARVFMYMIREGIEKAEATIIKPPSGLASA
jgi:hypothetical protein